MSYFILFLALMLLLCQSSAKVCDCPDYFRCACATNGLTYRNTCVYVTKSLVGILGWLKHGVQNELCRRYVLPRRHLQRSK
ncbi:uncharacterized protein LOC114356520 isoform X1 [Ostrinia furnacalis]|uniref:uncharacterized protein LOC114356520 isoform X1 n=1 Tax=Ostrinia furnacalis TaxID=93504 RepID=UPI00103FC827|nr:uncharacterized protein LOC114356520 isoform X1 [Ostrinia furnacalis]